MLLVVLYFLMSVCNGTGFGTKILYRAPSGPSSPCPSVFQYHYDGEEWYGIITSPSLPYGTPARLIARLSIGRVLPSKYAGLLELIGPRAEVLHAMLNEQPIRYKVNFPLPYPIPIVTAITINDKLICSGTPVAGPIVTSITLEHNLYPHGRNLNANVQPQQFPINVRDTRTTLQPLFQETTTPISQIFQRSTPLPNPPMFDEGKNFFRPPDTIENVIEKNIYDDICGNPVTVRPLVANGEPVQRGSYPWLVAIFAQKALGVEFTCGANLISKRHVITAAHCIKYGENAAITAADLLVILGKYKIHKWTERGTVTLEADEIILHPDYKSLNSDADLAVIVLSDLVNFSPTIRPICMWPKASDLSEFVGEFGTIVGWGRDETGLKITPEPRQTRVQVVSQEDCLRSRLEFRYITSNRTLCAGGVEQGSGPCSGDSGGGLLVQQNGKWYLRGIISMSLSDPKTKSCDLNHYSVFVDMAKFVDWISQFLH